MMSFVRIYAFQKGGAERRNNNVHYAENNVFFNLKPCKHITPNTQNNVIFSNIGNTDGKSLIIYILIDIIFNVCF